MPKSDGIPAGKKRYVFTLTEDTMKRMHAYISKNHAPKSMISSMVDELILDVLKTFDSLELAQQRKGSSLGFGDLITTIGKIMTDKDEEQKKLL